MLLGGNLDKAKARCIEAIVEYLSVETYSHNMVEALLS